MNPMYLPIYSCTSEAFKTLSNSQGIDILKDVFFILAQPKTLKVSVLIAGCYIEADSTNGTVNLTCTGSIATSTYPGQNPCLIPTEVTSINTWSGSPLHFGSKSIQVMNKTTETLQPGPTLIFLRLELSSVYVANIAWQNIHVYVE